MFCHKPYNCLPYYRSYRIRICSASLFDNYSKRCLLVFSRSPLWINLRCSTLKSWIKRRILFRTFFVLRWHRDLFIRWPQCHLKQPRIEWLSRNLIPRQESYLINQRYKHWNQSQDKKDSLRCTMVSCHTISGKSRSNVSRTLFLFFSNNIFNFTTN